MELTKKAFKAYDVRGVVPTEVNAEMAYRGRAAFLRRCLQLKKL